MDIQTPKFKDIDQQLSSSSNIKFYTQQDSFQYMDQNDPNPNQKIINTPLQFNRIIAQIITNINIMNKQIANNSTITNNLIQSGRQISKAKKQYWEKFVQDEQHFKFIRDAHRCLKPSQQQLLKNNVLVLSNLLLKLGINMSKVSIILLQKQVTYNCLSLFGLSVAFLQYLQHQLFKSKKIKQQIQSSLFLRQLPRITVIKLTNKRNTFETQLLQTSQQIFFTKNSRAPVKNLQFIQLYEEQDDFRKDFQRKTDYEHFISHNIKKRLGLTATFSFQLYYFLINLIFPQIKAFRPDMILFIQSYKDDLLIMDPQVRGLILSEMIQNLTPKIYFLREMGVSSFLYDNLIDKFPNWQTNYQPTMLREIQKQQLKIMLQIKKSSLAQPEVKKYLRDARKIYMDDLAFTALALIQKNSYHKLCQMARKHIYKQQFLECMNNMYEQFIGKTIIIDNDHYKQMRKVIEKNCSLTEKTKDFLKQNYDYVQNQFKNIVILMNKHNYYNQFFNLKTDQIEQLIVKDESHNAQYHFTDEDQIYVKYLQKKLIIFILKSHQFIILYKVDEDQFFTLGKKAKWQNQNQRLLSCILVCSDQYIYRSFGRFINNPRQYNNVIYRHRLQPDQNGNYGNWEQFAKKCIPLSSNGQQSTQIELQRKYSGYGYYDRQNKNIIMMGGYVDCANEEKISKMLYLIQKDSKPVLQMGKTNKMIFQTKSKLLLYPFVFGLPFPRKGGAMFLNTNGYLDHLNNSGKLFLTQINNSQIPIHNGIKWQSKLKVDIKPNNGKILDQMVDQQIDERQKYLNLKDRIVDYIVLAGDKINRYKGRCSLRTLNQGPWVLEIKQKTLYAKSYSKQNSQSFELPFE